jgi:hypothetical protein
MRIMTGKLIELSSANDGASEVCESNHARAYESAYARASN